jgi:hypothetical protein
MHRYVVHGSWRKREFSPQAVGLSGLGLHFSRFAFFTGADFAQEFPGIEAEVVLVVPVEFDGVFADGFRRERLGGGLEHRERSGGKFRGFAGTEAGLGALVFAQGAGASVAQVDKVVVGRVAVFPLDIHAGPGGEIHLHGLGICGRGRRLERGLHHFSIAQGWNRIRVWGAADAPLNAPDLASWAGAAGCGRGASGDDTDGETARCSGKNAHQSQNQHIFHQTFFAAIPHDFPL